MKYVVKSRLMIVLLFCIVMLAVYCGKYITFNADEKVVDYYEQMGINRLISGDREPIREQFIDGYLYKYYDDICLVFYESGGFVRAEITGDRYKLDDDISIGSERETVESAFIGKKKIKDLGKNQFGFIEDYIWVHFYFDENDTVEKILVYSGP